MLTIELEPRGAGKVATVRGVDLTKPLSEEEFGYLLWGLGEYGVLCLPAQNIAAKHLADFSARFGELHFSTINAHFVPGLPPVTVLSNILKDGAPIGIQDAGQLWHTDMSYNKTPGFLNALLARKVPMRNGIPLGSTVFANTQAAYRDLPSELKKSLANATATHSLAMYWEYVRTVKGSKRPPLTEQQKKERPPVSHPVFMTHPISGRKLIYVNPSFTAQIDGMDEEASKSTLKLLFDHVLQEKYSYAHLWEVGDLLLCDLIGTWHNATADYRPDEHRLLERCQVLGNKVMDPSFVAAALTNRSGATRVQV